VLHSSMLVLLQGTDTDSDNQENTNTKAESDCRGFKGVKTV